MAETTGIEWAHSTFNPWIGCTKVSPACDNCYAAVSTPARALGVTWGPGEARRRTSASNWHDPIRWNKKVAAAGERRRVFTASLADVFDAEVPDSWRQDLFSLIDETPALDWLVLTKRPKLMAEWSKANRLPSNVWAGTTVENQPMADLRIPFLMDVEGPSVRFLSMEPLLGQVDLERIAYPQIKYQTGIHYVDVLRGGYWSPRPFFRPSQDGEPKAFFTNHSDIKHQLINWVIAGGESGPGARWSHIDWFRQVRDQCEAAGVPFLFKQWGDWAPGRGGVVDSRIDGPDFKVIDPEFSVRRIGKKAAGRLLDGRTWDGVPLQLN